MEKLIPPTIKDKIRAIGYPNYGTLSVVIGMLSEFPDLQAKAKHECSRFAKWVDSSKAESYDNLRDKLEHRMDYERIDKLITQLYFVCNDGKSIRA